MVVLAILNGGVEEADKLQDRNHSLRVRSLYGFLPVQALILALICLAVLSGHALANPPSDVAVTYDQNAGDLVVTIAHLVDNPATHYVKQVTVRKDDTVLVDTSYTSQPDRTSFTYRYNLPQLKGSSGEIQVNVQCNQFGSRAGTLTMSATPAAGPVDSTAPAIPAPTKSPAGWCTAFIAIGFVARQILR